LFWTPLEKSDNQIFMSGAKKPVGKARNSSPLPPRYEIAASGSGRVAAPEPSYVSASAMSVVSATEAARSFSDLVNRACYQGETFVIERGGRPICQLGPLQGSRCTGADLLALFSKLPKPDEEFLDIVEALSRAQPDVERSPWDK